jgi:hypothetical protein
VQGVGAGSGWVRVRWGVGQAVQEVSVPSAQAEDSGGEFAWVAGVCGIKASSERGSVGPRARRGGVPGFPVFCMLCPYFAAELGEGHGWGHCWLHRCGLLSQPVGGLVPGDVGVAGHPVDGGGGIMRVKGPCDVVYVVGYFLSAASV